MAVAASSILERTSNITSPSGADNINLKNSTASSSDKYGPSCDNPFAIPTLLSTKSAGSWLTPSDLVDVTYYKKHIYRIL